ncbi:MAG TPA: TrmH family RNA methyltransferase, partial [Planctomycetes bacterium]|nr:TrmH family RNA methyltransferase [Planctomycetota bacterium]
MHESLQEYLKQCLTDDRLQRFDEVVKFRTRHLTVVLENVFHEHNASAVLRTCDCLGIQDVHVIESQNNFAPNPEVALGASKWLTIHNYR